MKKYYIDEIYKKLNGDRVGEIKEKDMRLFSKRVPINSDIEYWIQKFHFKEDSKIINDSHLISGCFINFTLEGEISLQTLDSNVTYFKNSTCISVANGLLSSLQTKSDQNNTNIGIFISFDFIKNNFENLINPCENRLLKQSKTSQISKIYLNQILNLNKNNSLDKLLIESKILEIIHNEFSDINAPKSHIILDEFDKAALIKAKENLAANLQNPPSIKELAKLVRLNEFKLKSGFKRLFNQTPYEFLNDLRMKQALAMAKSSELNIHEISLAVGFKNQGYFSRVFQKYHGVSVKDMMKARSYYY